MQKILIVGATSAITEEVIKILAPRKYHFVLIARNQVKLDTIAANLKILGAIQVDCIYQDLSDPTMLDKTVNQAIAVLKNIDLCLVGHGSLSDQTKCNNSYLETEKELRINLLSVIAILTPIANYMAQQGYGQIAVISSPSGDRGRKANYTYGTAKAALNVYLQGLRNRLHPAVNVLTIKPGFVDTPMTKDLPKTILFADAKVVARDIVKAIDTKKEVIYTPWYWFFIMLIIKHIPEKIFKRLSI